MSYGEKTIARLRDMICIDAEAAADGAGEADWPEVGEFFGLAEDHADVEAGYDTPLAPDDVDQLAAYILESVIASPWNRTIARGIP